MPYLIGPSHQFVSWRAVFSRGHDPCLHDDFRGAA